MARVDAKAGQISFTIKAERGSAVFVVPSGDPLPKRVIESSRRIYNVIPTQRILAVVQDAIDYGLDYVATIDSYGNWAKAEAAIRAAQKEGYTRDELMANVDTILADTRTKREGPKLGSEPTLWEDVRAIFNGSSELIWQKAKPQQERAPRKKSA